MGVSSATALEGGRARVMTPLFTIVTSSFNQADFLEEAIQSVQSQGRRDVEHVVIDGGSSDGSVDILRRHDADLAYWVSAPDAGQPAAWNAGVRRARGAIVGFLNSDDVYLPGALDEMARLSASEPSAEWLLGGTTYFGPGSGGLVYPGVVPTCVSDVLYFVTYVPQQGHFFRRTLIERVGGFDESHQFSFDLDFFVRSALAGAVAAATPRIVAGFRWHGESKTVAQRAEQVADTLRVEHTHWPEIERREGARARRARAKYHGHLALEAARDALLAGERLRGWRLLVAAGWQYPSMLTTRAFAGTVQRLLGLRRAG